MQHSPRDSSGLFRIPSLKAGAAAILPWAILLAAIAGCGSADSQSGPSATSSDASSAASTASSSAQHPVELRFWHAWGGYEGKYLESLIEEFNRTHPGIVVRPTFFNIGDKLLAAIAGGKPPDVATVWDYMLGTMGESGCFLPLEDRLRAAGFDESAYLPHIWEYGMYGRHKWGAPTTMNALGIYYNRRLAREAGLDPDRPPETIAELEEWAAKLTVRDPATGRLARIGFVPITAHCWFWNHGGGVFDLEHRKFTIDRPENVRALEWMTSMYKKVGMEDFRRLSAGFGKLDSPQNPFFVGKMAMKEDGQWVTQFIREYAPDLDYGVMPFPSAVPGQPGVTSAIGSFWVIPQGTRHPEEAWTFLRWLISPEQSARFCAKLHNIPPLRATLELPEFKETLADKNFAAFVKMILDGRGRTRPALPVGQELEEKLAFQIDVVFGGRIAPRDYLSNLQKEMVQRLEFNSKLLGVEDDSPTAAPNSTPDSAKK